jgi:PhnB protein
MRSAASAIAFYKQAFGASELMRLTDDTGRVRHSEIKIGNSVLMLVDEHEPPVLPFMRSAQSLGGSPIELFLYVDDVDAVARQAIAAGAKEILPVTDSEEDRRGGVMDPFGLVWWIATRIEDWSREEIQRRFEATMKQPGH